MLTAKTRSELSYTFDALLTTLAQANGAHYWIFSKRMDEWTHIESGRQDHHGWVSPCGDAGGKEPEVPPDASSSCPKWPQEKEEGEEEEC